MTKPWFEICAHYDAHTGDSRSIRALATLARTIAQGPLSVLFAWTSMFDLNITQTEVEYPYDGPRLRVSPVSREQLEFRYIDTSDHTKQWNRTVNADEAEPRLIKFLEQLRWFPPETLKSPTVVRVNE